MSKDRLLRNTSLLILGTIINKGILLLAIPLFSRWLSTEEFGLFDVYTTYVSLIIPIVTLSIGDAVFRFGIDSDSINGKSEFVTDGFVVEFTALLLFVIVMSVGFRTWEYVIPFTLYAVAEGINIYLLGYLRCIRKLNIYSFCSAVSTAFTFLFVFLFVKQFDLGLIGMLIGYTMGVTINNLIIIIYTKYHRYITFNKVKFAVIKKMVKYSFALVLSNMSWWIVNVSDRWLINIYLGAYYNGIYSASAKLPNLITTLTSMFNISWQEAAVDNISNSDRLVYYNKTYNKMCKLMITAACCCVAANFIVFDWFFDNRYFDGRLYMPILVISSVFHGLIFYFTGINISMKRPHYNSICVFVGAATNFLINLTLIQRIGLYAAAISTLISNVLIFVIIQITAKDVFVAKYDFTTILCAAELILVFTLDLLDLSIVIKIVVLALTGITFILANKSILAQKLNKGKQI